MKIKVKGKAKLLLRLLTGVVLLGAVTILILEEDALLLSFVLLFILTVNALEWHVLLKKHVRFFGKSLSPVFLLLLILIGLFWVPINFATEDHSNWFSLSVLVCLLYVCAEVLFYRQGQKVGRGRKFLGVAMFFIVPFLFYVCALFIYALSVNLALLIFLMIVCIDIGGYAGGKLVGGKKLCPELSPNKTFAGFWGGIVLCYVVYALFVNFVPLALPAEVKTPLFMMAIFPVTCLTQIGDLYQSVLKRRVGVKNSGELLPGHGGVFDRMDNMLFGIPLFYIFISVSLIQ